MPIKVPVRRVAEEPLPGARLSPGTPDAGAFEAGVITRLGSQVADVGASALGREEQEGKEVAARAAKREKSRLKFQDDKDKLHAEQGVVRFNNYLRDLDVKYATKVGTEAEDMGTEANKEIESAITTMNDLAANDNERRYLNSALITPRETFLDRQSRREVGAHIKNDLATTEASYATNLRDAENFHYDDNELLRTSKNLKDIIKKRTRGMSPEQTKKVSADMRSAYHEAVLNGKIPFNAENAQEYYDRNEMDILPDKREDIKALLDKEDTLQFAQETTDEFEATIPDRKQWSSTLRKIEMTPEKRKATDEHLARRKTQLDQKDAETQEDELLYALEGIRNAPDLDASQIFIDGIKDPVDAATAQKVSDARFDLKKADIITDRTVQANVFDMIDKGVIKDPRQLIEFSYGLSTKDYDRLVTELRNKDNPDANTGVMNHPTAVKAFEASTKDKYDVTDDTQNAEFNFLYDRLDEESKKKGGPLDYYEALKVADKVLVEGGVFGAGVRGTPEQTLFEATQAGTVDKWLPDINDESDDGGKELRDIKKSLKTIDVITDDERIFRFYKKESILRIPLSKTESEDYNWLLRRSGVVRPVTR